MNFKVKNILLKKIKKIISSIFKIFNYKLVKDLPLIYIHDYKSYEEYAAVQKFYNKKKIDRVWSDSRTLKIVAERLLSDENIDKKNIQGICHGSRNGFEVKKLLEYLENSKIIGTDISETAINFPNQITWDFHNEKIEWLAKFDFIYTNSLDQSWKPFKAMDTWFGQLRTNGLLFIEHTRAHGVEGASEMDPFGVLPEYMPYVITKHFGSKISLEIQKSIKSNIGIEVWLFILRKLI